MTKWLTNNGLQKLRGGEFDCTKNRKVQMPRGVPAEVWGGEGGKRGDKHSTNIKIRCLQLT